MLYIQEVSNSNLDGFITVIDFETTSIVPGEARAVEIGLVALDSKLNVISTFETIINSPIPSNPFAERVSKISNSMKEQARPFNDYWPTIAPFFNDRVLVAHNASYDLQVLANELRAIGEIELPPIVCTLKMAQRVYPTSMAGNHKLESLAAYFKIDFNSHQALDDALATTELLKIMLHEKPTELRVFVEATKSLRAFQSKGIKEIPPVTRMDLVNSDISLAQTKLKATPAQALRSDSELLSIVGKIRSGSKSVVALTGTPSVGKIDFTRMASEIGLSYSRNPVGKTVTALLVVGIDETGQTKLFDAKKYSIPVLSDEEWIRFHRMWLNTQLDS